MSAPVTPAPRTPDPDRDAYMAGLFAYLAEHHPLPDSLRQPAPRRRWCRFLGRTR